MANTHTWTDAQLSAINTRGKTLLVSAAAGSGKTATLTERIIQSLTRENDPAKTTYSIGIYFLCATANYHFLQAVANKHSA